MDLVVVLQLIMMGVFLNMEMPEGWKRLGYPARTIGNDLVHVLTGDELKQVVDLIKEMAEALEDPDAFYLNEDGLPINKGNSILKKFKEWE